MSDTEQPGDAVDPRQVTELDKEILERIDDGVRTEIVCVIRAQHKETREWHSLLATVETLPDGHVKITPLARLFASNPTHMYERP